MQYILGLDQGGTKTAAIILDSKGNILGLGLSMGAYHTEDGIEYAMSAVFEAVKAAEQSSHIKLSDIDILVAGMTGMDWPHERNLLKSALIHTTGIKNVEVYNDCIIAMYGGLNKEYGAVLCAGTGLNCAVRTPLGEEFILGFYIDDNAQGGSALGRRAIRKVLDAEIGLCHDTKLKEMVLNYTGKRTVEEFIYWYAINNDGIEGKNLVPEIMNIAKGGDEVANELLIEFSNDICKYIYAGLKKYDMLNLEVDIVLSGGIFKGEKNPLKEYVTKYTKEFAPKASIIDARYEPVVGAGIMGMLSLNNCFLDDEMKENIAKTAEKLNLNRR